MRPTVPLLCLSILLAGCTGQPDPAKPADQATAQNSVCLRTDMIDNTSIPDDSTILFHMKDGKIWKNSLPFNCPGLKNQGGFEFTASFYEVCSNAQAIRVLRQNSQCMLGAFTPYVEPPTKPQ
ncbi:MAG: DUF6491 family protein [Aliidongia sp.]